MPKRPIPDLSTTAFSINRQFTGPPFSVRLESAELHRHLLEELAHPLAEQLAQPTAGAKPRTKSGRSARAKRPAGRTKKKK